MLKWMIAGESHGKSLVGIIDGIPAGVIINTRDIQKALARRRLGYGRGPRMKIEKDDIYITGGVRHGRTIGSSIAIIINNTEWPKWEKIMSPDPVNEEDIKHLARNSPLIKPRPGHVDLAGMQKYGFDDARNVLEPASARETAMRVALGEVASKFLSMLDIRTVAHTISIGEIFTSKTIIPNPDDEEKLDKDPLRCFDEQTSYLMVKRINQAKKEGCTLGGIVEILAYGVPAGLGNYAQSYTRLDARIASAFMGIQAIKGVEVGNGFSTTMSTGRYAHDEIFVTHNGDFTRKTNYSGGIEGGISNGSIIRIRAAMKPISTTPKALKTINIKTREQTIAHHQRSDICAVPAVGVIAQAMLNLVLTDSILEKFGGDNIKETYANLKNYNNNNILKTMNIAGN